MSKHVEFIEIVRASSQSVCSKSKMWITGSGGGQQLFALGFLCPTCASTNAKNNRSTSTVRYSAFFFVWEPENGLTTYTTNPGSSVMRPSCGGDGLRTIQENRRHIPRLSAKFHRAARMHHWSYLQCHRLPVAPELLVFRSATHDRQQYKNHAHLRLQEANAILAHVPSEQSRISWRNKMHQSASNQQARNQQAADLPHKQMSTQPSPGMQYWAPGGTSCRPTERRKADFTRYGDEAI